MPLEDDLKMVDDKIQSFDRNVSKEEDVILGLMEKASHIAKQLENTMTHQLNNLNNPRLLNIQESIVSATVSEEENTALLSDRSGTSIGVTPGGVPDDGGGGRVRAGGRGEGKHGDPTVRDNLAGTLPGKPEEKQSFRDILQDRVLRRLQEKADYGRKRNRDGGDSNSEVERKSHLRKQFSNEDLWKRVENRLSAKIESRKEETEDGEKKLREVQEVEGSTLKSCSSEDIKQRIRSMSKAMGFASDFQNKMKSGSRVLEDVSFAEAGLPLLVNQPSTNTLGQPSSVYEETLSQGKYMEDDYFSMDSTHSLFSSLTEAKATSRVKAHEDKLSLDEQLLAERLMNYLKSRSDVLMDQEDDSKQFLTEDLFLQYFHELSKAMKENLDPTRVSPLATPMITPTNSLVVSPAPTKSHTPLAPHSALEKLGSDEVTRDNGSVAMETGCSVPVGDNAPGDRVIYEGVGNKTITPRTYMTLVPSSTVISDEGMDRSLDGSADVTMKIPDQHGDIMSCKAAEPSPDAVKEQMLLSQPISMVSQPISMVSQPISMVSHPANATTHLDSNLLFLQPDSKLGSSTASADTVIYVADTSALGATVPTVVKPVTSERICSTQKQSLKNRIKSNLFNAKQLFQSPNVTMDMPTAAALQPEVIEKDDCTVINIPCETLHNLTGNHGNLDVFDPNNIQVTVNLYPKEESTVPEHTCNHPDHDHGPLVCNSIPTFQEDEIDSMFEDLSHIPQDKRQRMRDLLEELDNEHLYGRKPPHDSLITPRSISSCHSNITTPRCHTNITTPRDYSVPRPAPPTYFPSTSYFGQDLSQFPDEISGSDEELDLSTPRPAPFRNLQPPDLSGFIVAAEVKEEPEERQVKDFVFESGSEVSLSASEKVIKRSEMNSPPPAEHQEFNAVAALERIRSSFYGIAPRDPTPLSPSLSNETTGITPRDPSPTPSSSNEARGATPRDITTPQPPPPQRSSAYHEDKSQQTFTLPFRLVPYLPPPPSDEDTTLRSRSRYYYDFWKRESPTVVGTQVDLALAEVRAAQRAPYRPTLSAHRVLGRLWEGKKTVTT